MDSVKEKDTEELLDIGVCPSHNRLYECYCTDCFWFVSPNPA